MNANELGTHKGHCCIYHGCKYGDSDCPVVDKTVVQSGPCEHCGLGLEGFYGEDDRKMAVERWPDDWRAKEKCFDGRAKYSTKARQLLCNCPCQADDEPPNVFSEKDIHTPVIRLVQVILKDAVIHKATEIHLTPTNTEIITEYVIDGKLEKQVGPPIRLYSAIVSRIKLMAGMLLSVRNRVQNGVIETTIKGRRYVVEVETIPHTNIEREERVVISNIVPLPLPEISKDSLECQNSKPSLPETETYLHHDGYVVVQKHLKGKHREHCLCWQGCNKFKPGKDNCRKSNLLFAFCQAFNMTTPVWECPDYTTEDKMD